MSMVRSAEWQGCSLVGEIDCQWRGLLSDKAVV